MDKEGIKNLRFIHTECSIKRKEKTQSNIKKIITKCRIGLKTHSVYFKIKFIEELKIENMWVKVTKINDDTFTGTIDNNPFTLTNCQCGDIVTLKFTDIEDYAC